MRDKDLVGREPKHEARLHPWQPGELKTRLGEIVDALVERGDCSPLDVALELLSGELDTFLLVGRMGHLDPPRADGKIAWTILRRLSEDPVVNKKLLEAVSVWLADQEEQPSADVAETIADAIETITNIAETITDAAETITDAQIVALFERHCECRPTDTTRMTHSHDCDKLYTDACREALNAPLGSPWGALARRRVAALIVEEQNK